jgi:hypothetical protein
VYSMLGGRRNLFVSKTLKSKYELKIGTTKISENIVLGVLILSVSEVRYIARNVNISFKDNLCNWLLCVKGSLIVASGRVQVTWSNR